MIPATKGADEERARWSAWKRIEQHQRQRLVLEALGDVGLTVSELAERLATPQMTVNYTDVYPLLTQHMELAGEVYRVAEPWKGTKTRARWFRNTKLSGPIAELQRALEEGA